MNTGCQKRAQQGTGGRQTRVLAPTSGQRSPRGFTLIEMMMVVFIVATISMVIIPAVSQLIRKQDTSLVRDELVEAVEYAHTQAIASGHVFTLTVRTGDQSTNGQVEIREATNPSETCTEVATGDKIVRTVILAPHGTTVSGMDVPGQPKPRVIETTVRISDVAPASFGNGGSVCFKSDGSMRDAATNMPVTNVDTNAPNAGDVVVRFQDFEDGHAIGVENHVVLSYNGVARAKF